MRGEKKKSLFVTIDSEVHDVLTRIAQEYAGANRHRYKSYHAYFSQFVEDILVHEWLERIDETGY